MLIGERKKIGEIGGDLKKCLNLCLISNNNFGWEKMKKCHLCGEVKSLANFYKDASKPDGYANRCKQCDNRKRKDYYSTHK
jgi:hypothetical protein